MNRLTPEEQRTEIGRLLRDQDKLTEENARLRAELEAELLRTHMLKPVMDEYERLKAQKENILAKQQDKLAEENARLRADIHNYAEEMNQLEQKLFRAIAALNKIAWLDTGIGLVSIAHDALAELEG